MVGKHCSSDKKNGKLRVCVDFRDLNDVTPKDMYVMPFIDGFSGYNKILIVVDDISKTAFRCPGSLRMFE